MTLRPRTPSGDDAATLPAQAPIALGFNGQAFFHPDRNSSSAKADNGAQFISAQSIAEAHLWAGGSFSNRTTFFGELTATSEHTIDVEVAQVHFNDLIGPAHLFNLRVGRGPSNLSSFGPHSTFLADALMTSTPATALAGATSDSWALGGHFNGVEASGVVAGRVAYNVGWNAGTNVDTRSAEDVYGHIGVKFGGLSMDGESGAPSRADRPWEETSLTVDAFAYHSRSGVHFAPQNVGEDQIFLQDTANVFGGALRGQWASLELNTGAYIENHLHAQSDGTSAVALAQYDELSYIVFPWLVPAVRFELTQFRPDAACGGGGGACPNVTDMRLIPGVALLPYPNLKFVVSALIEHADGVPPGGWGAVGGASAPEPGTSSLELQSVAVSAFFAF